MNDSLTYNPCVPIPHAHTSDFFSRSPEETRAIGDRLGHLLVPGDLICLQGELGAGKTTLVQGLAQGWGSQDEVTSPTFVLVNEYRRPNGARFFHMDAYRLEGEREAAELDVDRMLTEGALIVEWPERIASSPARRGAPRAAGICHRNTATAEIQGKWRALRAHAA